MATSGTLKTSGYNGRYLELSWEITNSQADRIETNKTKIAWTLTGAGDAPVGYYYAGAFKVHLAGQTVFTQSARIQLYAGTKVASGTLTLTHATDGTKSFDAYVEAGIYLYEVNCTGKTTVTLDQIPRASTLTAGNGTLGTEQAITITRAASTFKHRLTYNCGDISGYIAGSTTSYSTATSFKWTPPLGLAQANTTGTSLSVKLTLYTYTSDGSHVGTTAKTITCTIPSSVAPSCTIAWEDITGHAATYGAPVRGLSKLKITVTAKTSQSSPIASYSINANGSKYDASPATTDVLRTAGTNTISATVKDKRGRSGSTSETMDVLTYSAPVVSKLTVRRCNQDGSENDQGDYVQVVFSAIISPLGNKNTAAYKLRYKQTTADTFTEATFTSQNGKYTVTDQSYIFAADGNASYDVEVIATDAFSSHTRATSVSTAFTLLNWHTSGTGMGVGKVSEKENTVEFGIVADFQSPVQGKVYGLSTLPAVPENGDLNDYLTPGAYAVRNNTIAATVANIPIQQAGRLLVSHSTGNVENLNSKWQYIEQKFIPYMYGVVGRDQPVYVRYISQDGGDTFIIRTWFNEALKAYPVGSIHLRYDHQDPADLFGGTWARITSYILRGAAANDTIGSTGTLADGSGRTYVNISIWRRTA